MTQSAVKSLARDSEFEQSMLNVQPQFKEDINPSKEWTKTFHKLLVIQSNLYKKRFN